MVKLNSELLINNGMGNDHTNTQSAGDAFNLILKYAGAFPRDIVDKRAAADARLGIATYMVGGSPNATWPTPSVNGLIDSQSAVGGWPSYTSKTAPNDTDNDGIPDGWLDSNYPGKKANQKNEQGYTYLEIYLNTLAAGLVGQNSRVIPVSTSTQLINAIAEANNGDTIVLTAGDYDITGGTRFISQSITIKANSTAEVKPKIRGSFTINAGVSFAIIGTEVYYNNYEDVPTGNHLINAQYASYYIPTISLMNCHIHGFGRSLFRADNSVNKPTIENLIVDNCIIEDMGRHANSYSVFAAQYANISNALLVNSTFYNCKNGIWQGIATNNHPIDFLMKNCCVFKTTTTGSKRVLVATTNPGSVYTIRGCVFSNSYDGITTNLQLSLGANGTTHLAHLDNVIMINDFASPKITGTVLSTNKELATNSLGYNYSNFSITTSPDTIHYIGDPRWIVNGVSTGYQEIGAVEHPYPTSHVRGFINDNVLFLENVPLNATIQVFNLTGSLLFSAITNETTFRCQFSHPCIVRVSSTQSKPVYLKIL